MHKVSKILAILLIAFLSLYILAEFSEHLELVAPEKQLYRGKQPHAETSAPANQDRRFALVIPATSPSPELCKTMFSAIALGYPSPVIINWGVDFHDLTHWELGKNLPKIPGFVEYLDSVMHPNATHLEKLEEDDIVLMVDGYDVWFQLPPQVLLSRYHQINKEANERLRKQWTKKEPMPMKQTIVVASQKKCYPANPDRFGVDLRCDQWPTSPLRADLYGPETDKNDTNPHDNRPRWINGGMYIGPAGDMRRLFRRAKEKMDALLGEGLHAKSEQGMLGAIIGEQTVWRQWQREHNTDSELEDLVGKNLEFHVGVDYGQDISAQTLLIRISKEDDLDDGDFILLGNQTTIEQHSEAWGISPARLNGVPDDIKTAPNPLTQIERAANWSEMPLYTDFFLGSVPIILHHNKYKERRATWWDRPWYHRRLRELLTPNLRATEQKEPLATVKLDEGRIRYWAASAETTDRYPRMVGGLVNGTTYSRFSSVVLEDTCRFQDREADKYSKYSKEMWWEEVFRDGAGRFKPT
ncbi:hypothetical protein F53441_6301 [Fusarium austroafricanum]|uniref:Uncharacterized protein n=1 Tax=Fusarium austroafricanum TaxID=2364996 RepID=A0A8H4KG23_9HYPO|nr:hypothetical protein F53441_6301 [Fusarium austroafricanum]